MPDQYDINYNQQVIELLPPDKRYKNMVAWLSSCMLSTLQYLRDAVLGDYRKGSTVSNWTTSIAYTRNTKVNYENAIFVSLVDGNNDNPGNSPNWYMQQQFFIGLTERLAYNGSNMVLTYALNRWFGTTFRQPTSIANIGGGYVYQPYSDLYITTNNIAQSYFQVGYTEAESSYVGYFGSGGSVGDVDGVLGTQYNCNVYVPSVLVTSLGGTQTAVALISSFINKYIIAGCVYQIIQY